MLALGHSGVRGVVERMVEMLNRDLIPVVPEQGSLGASGDLAPLANLALPLVGRGELLVDGTPQPAGDVLRSAATASPGRRACSRSGSSRSRAPNGSSGRPMSRQR